MSFQIQRLGKNNSPSILEPKEGEYMRRAAKVDENQSEIVAALRAVGCKVQSLAQLGQGVPDLLVGTPAPRRELVLLEVKDGSRVASQKQLTDAEKQWHSVWNLYKVFVVESAPQAVDLVRSVARVEIDPVTLRELNAPQFASEQTLENIKERKTRKSTAKSDACKE